MQCWFLFPFPCSSPFAQPDVAHVLIVKLCIPFYISNHSALKEMWPEGKEAVTKVKIVFG